LKIKRKVPQAAPCTPFGAPLQRRKAAQKQCADNHLRPKGARIENPLYLALIFLPFSSGLDLVCMCRIDTANHLQNTLQNTLQFLPSISGRFALNVPILCN